MATSLEDETTKTVLVGQKTTTTNANNEQFITYTNLDGNVTKLEFVDKNSVKSVLIENTFDSYGNLTLTNDHEQDSEISLKYDEFGRVIEKTFTQNGTKIAVNNIYDRYGNVTKTTICIGENTQTYTNNYDYSTPTPRLNSTGIGDITESYSYDKLSRISETKLGSLYSKQFSYLQKGNYTSNLIACEWFGIKGVIKDSLKYSYDKNGNITKVFENGEEIARYSYDSLSRLIREDNKKLNKTTTFQYDGGGNITKKTIFAYSTKPTELLENGTTLPYLYPTSGWRDQLQSYNDESIVYDALGNPTTYRNNDLKWSHGRQLDKFNDIEFKYNADGIRTSKIADGKKTEYFYDGTSLIAQSDGNMLTFHYGAEGVIGFTYQGVGEYYYIKNIFGDVIAIIDKNGQKIAKYEYDAWGNHKIGVLNEGKFVDISSNLNYTQDGLNNKTIALLNPFRYRIYYYDSETNLYYLNSRYYDPETGRFINADDITNLDSDSINGLNLYAYCGNNPVNDVDENGNWSWKKFWKTLLTVVVAVVAVAIVAVISVASGGSAVPVLIGAGIGMLTSGITSTITQLSSGGGFDISQLFVDMAFGTFTGALGGSTFGLLGVTIGNTISGFASSVASNFVAGENINWERAGLSTFVGFVSGLASGAGAQNGLTSHTNQLMNSRSRILSNIKVGNYSPRGANGAMNLINFQISKSRAIVKQLGVANVFKNFLKTNVEFEAFLQLILHSL